MAAAALRSVGKETHTSGIGLHSSAFILDSPMRYPPSLDYDVLRLAYLLKKRVIDDAKIGSARRLLEIAHGQGAKVSTMRSIRTHPHMHVVTAG